MIVRTKSDLLKAKKAGALLAAIMHRIKQAICPGISTMDLEILAKELFTKLQNKFGLKVKPAFLGYHGYKYILCVSVNQVVVHGLPAYDVVLKKGDLVSVDCGLIYEGMYSDMAFSVLLDAGQIHNEAYKKHLLLLRTTKEVLEKAILKLKPGVDLYKQVSSFIYEFVKQRNFDVVKDYAGHGIGYNLHEDPQIPNYYLPIFGSFVLKKGMLLCLEPMVIDDEPEGCGVYVAEDGWSVVTKSNNFACHFEHTILVDNPPLVLTKYIKSEDPFI